MKKDSNHCQTTMAHSWKWATLILLVLSFHNGWADDSVEANEMPDLTESTPLVVPSSDPDFEEGTANVVRVAVGTTAYLTCRPRSLRNKTLWYMQVSWVRHRDVHILTVGRYTYTKDGRFTVYHQRHTGEWTLQLRSAQLKDSGLYECQIGTQPTRSFFVNLQVVEPTTAIYGGPDMHVHEGSPVNISCLVYNAVGQPEFFFWYHNGQVVEFDGDRYEQREYFAENDETVSSFLIKSAQLSDSGNYTCQPAHCPAVSAKVYILKGEQPAAMQRSAASDLHPLTPPLLLLMMNVSAPGQWRRLLLVLAAAVFYSSCFIGFDLLMLDVSLFS